MLCLAAIAMPKFIQISYDIRLRSGAANLSGLMQQARILAAKQNAVYTIAYQAVGTVEVACVDLNVNGTCDANEPTVTFARPVVPAAAAPSGGGGQPAPYVLVGDTGTTVYTNGTTLGYSSRGLPCSYSGGTCLTPAAGYFVYYLTDTRPGGLSGWAAVIVTRSGRSKVSVWNGSSWS
jgi:Tfp pilus assembly protein FimT